MLMLGDDILLQWLHWVSDGFAAAAAVFMRIYNVGGDYYSLLLYCAVAAAAIGRLR